MKSYFFVFVAFVLTLTVALFFPADSVWAGGGRIELSSSAGTVGTTAATVTATIYLDTELTQPAPGVVGSFSFENPQTGQSCSTTNNTSDAQGKIYGSCTSATLAGQYSAVFTTDGEEPRTVAITFTAPPSPSPSPSPSAVTQVVSGTYKLELSETNVTFSNLFNSGYALNATLRDAANNAVIINQSGIEYSWSTNDSSIVQVVQVNEQCNAPVQVPCPRINASFRGYKPGTTTVKVVARKGGQQIGEATATMTVTQTTSGTAYYTPSPTSSPKVSPSLSPTPSASPKASASPTASPQVSPSPEPTPLDENFFDKTSTTVSPSVSPLAQSQTGSATNSFATIMLWLVIILSIGTGLGLPIGWYVLEQRPELKQKLRSFFKLT